MTVVLIPAMAGRHPAMKPIVSLPRAMPSASASSTRPCSRHLSTCTSALISVRLATSPAAAPPTPSATAASRGLAKTASSLLGRRPTSLRAVHSSIRPVMDGTVTD